ncbi:4Fe-4S dicluster domain-containing protein [Mycoplasmatota bacterium]|nr:4Fe-4S dicluster domain-containing protein [Mycoplasmatota bacterium]
MNNFISLNKNSCKNCYKCIRNCPVKSIKFSANQANVVIDECILCGHCYVVCPQNAKEVVSDIEKAKVILQQNDKVIASLAPSFIANYDGADINSLKEALKKLGFYDVEETAIGAQIVKEKYEDYIEQMNPNIFITSACHSVNLLIQKYYPELIHFLAPIISPMQAHALDIKKRNKDAKVIFIGPCIAKKDEADHYQGIVDCVLTYEELSRLLSENDVQIDIKEDKESGYLSRFFPTAGGIIKSLKKRNESYDYIAIDGAEQCIDTLEDIKRVELSHCFIEMSICKGSCIGGPIMEKHHKTPLKDYLRVIHYGGEKDYPFKDNEEILINKDFKVIMKDEDNPTDDEIQAIMNQMGKHHPKDELNCGSCGYNTCREKAIAVIKGKADLSMCLPFLKERAESFYHNILNHTPSGIIVLNKELEIQQLNNTAKNIFNIRRRNDILGEKINILIDDKPIYKVMESNRKYQNNQLYLAEYKKHVKQTIIYDKNFRIFMVLIDDISDEINHRNDKKIMNQKTVEITDQVVEKQMRIVQEIASLLGETAAETKIVLSKLKEQILNE